MKYRFCAYCLTLILAASIHSVYGAAGDSPQAAADAAQTIPADQAKQRFAPAATLPAASTINISELSKQEGKQLPPAPADQSATALPKRPAPVTTPGIDLQRMYKIGAGDVLNLSVWKDEALSRQVVVLPDGTISLPLIGQLLAADKTVTELEQEITTRIKRYLPEPILDVSVAQVNSMLIYVIGKVRSPGRFPVHADINVLQALSIAGGLDKHASESNIKIYRQEDGKTRFFTFEYDEVTDGDKLEQNIQLQRGDVVVVP